MNQQPDCTNTPDTAYTCPNCPNVDLQYIGIEDGTGDYGTALCEAWQCPNCLWQEHHGCIEAIDDDGNYFGDQIKDPDNWNRITPLPVDHPDYEKGISTDDLRT